MSEKDLSEDESSCNHNLKQHRHDATTVDTVGGTTIDTVGATTAESSSQLEDDDSRNDLQKMSIFKYNRIGGSLCRDDSTTTIKSSMGPLSSLCTSVKLGQIILPLEEDTGQQEQQNQQQNIDPSLWQKPHYVMFAGFENGSLSFVDMESGTAIIPSNQLKVPELSDSAIMDVSLDARTNYLAAINARGTCGIWEVQFSRRSAPQTHTPQADVFSFFTTLGGQSMNDDSKQGEGSNDKPSIVLNVSSIQGSSISYPSSFGRATCLMLDPNYTRRREKLLLVGYGDGKLVLTKRAFLQMRNDSVIYQGTPGSSDYRGIEALTWRGALVAWADASGIKLFDIESMSRIAHVDRPAGARSSLYPTISYLRPTLMFETSDALLVTWGDCVMGMDVKEVTVTVRKKPQPDMMTALTHGSATPEDVPPTTVKRRQVECNMAWELDCIANGVVPLDKEHLIVLGLVPKEEDNGKENDVDQINDLELQVISRSTGTVTYADIIPLTKHASEVSSKESACNHHLLSTFAVPCMDENISNTNALDQDFMKLFSGTSTNENVVDSHLGWDLKMLDVDGAETERLKSNDCEEDDISTDSDDYSFILRQQSGSISIPASLEKGTVAPMLVIASPGDFVCAKTLDIDDAISHALSLNKVGLALQRAMRYKRQLRKHDINNISNVFLQKVLCLGKPIDDRPQKQKLSIRRLELAAKSTPALLGGNSQRWKYWINEFSRLPGALFVLWDQLPVRDPKLPGDLYKTVLNNLYSEIEDMLLFEGTIDKPLDMVVEKAIKSFLRALSAWGPTHALQEKVEFHEYFLKLPIQETQQTKNANLRYLEDRQMLLERRRTQSAAGYLEFPSGFQNQSSTQSGAAVTKNRLPMIGSSSDSLFDIKSLLPQLSSRLIYLNSDQSNSGDGESEVSSSLLNTKIAFDAFAELSVMNMDYETALKCYLLVGHLFAFEPLEEIEESAIGYVNKGKYKIPDDGNYSSGLYGFVIAMIEKHHLHRLLLEQDFFPGISTPLISFIQLVGLELVGGFLVEHCTPPPVQSTSISTTSESSRPESVDSNISSTTKERDETLPITSVAKQLQSSPPLLHWYLHLIFQLRPEIYVQFSTTAVPPISVTELHRAHLDLYIEYAEDKDSALVLSETELYNHERKMTPLLLFLKAALPLGGIQVTEVRRLLESKRIENLEDIVEFPRSYALELAYVIENYGDKSEEESYQVLDLYLKGTKSVMLAVAYAQRDTDYSNILWETLIQYCLEGGESKTVEYEEGKIDGTLFGSLLEVAALCGADLALLVTSIPQGMNIEGLRPRLVAAVADYRMKLKMHEASTETCREDRLRLLQEVEHRSRRGMRQIKPSNILGISDSQGSIKSSAIDSSDQIKRRPIERPSRYRLSIRLPMR